VTAFLDTHVHWWDPANPWMLMATQEQADALRMGDVSGMKRAYGPAEYRRDTAGHDVAGVVWVMATMDVAGTDAEVRWIQEQAGDDPLLAAIIGSVDPTLPPRERQASLQRQASAPKFRGVRVLAGLEWGATRADEYLRMLADGGYLYEDMSHHGSMADAARLAERHPDVPWILEHCGWPQHPDDPDDVAAWREGIRALAGAGEHVHCKLSGLAMSTHSFDPAAQRPFLEHCIEAFGPERCMFGSNFPVDRLYGTFDAMTVLHRDVTAGLPNSVRDGLLRSNAERVYGI
jgi:predicted TIM-barrel fold metal-dependent hydrolase